MTTYLLLKWVHVLSSVVLVGTGLGTAYGLAFANRSRDVAALAVVTRQVVRADLWFTTPAVVVQPVTGVWLAHLAGWPLGTPWIALSIALYLLAGACWLPVLWLQLRMADMARRAAARAQPLPDAYWRCARWWERLGWPAFTAMAVVFYLMVAKPPL
jgi:uncharacterized membrane protein